MINKQAIKGRNPLGIALACLILCGMLLSGCSSKGVEPSASQNTAASGTASNGSGAASESPPAETTPFPAYDYQGRPIVLKGYDTAADRTLSYQYDIPAGTATHLGTVLEAYNTVFKLPVLGGDPITARTITLENGVLHFDFTHSIYGNYGSGTEAALIENLFWAYFENMPDIEKIYISVEGAPYETGHIMFALDEAILRPDDASSGAQ
jgi:hypothetical protein